ncbi:MAG: hypothetical protein ACRCZO_08805 [Cetobacterium sp.]
MNKELNLNAEFFKPENLKVDADVQIVKVDYSFGDRETLAIDLGYRF